MTNGEKIQTILNVDRDCTEGHGENGTMTFTVTQNLWDTEYKEPTTKNDLVVDCVARKDIERYIEGFINEYTPKEELEFINLELDGLKHLPSVTPQEPILDKIRAEIENMEIVYDKSVNYKDGRTDEEKANSWGEDV